VKHYQPDTTNAALNIGIRNGRAKEKWQEPPPTTFFLFNRILLVPWRTIRLVPWHARLDQQNPEQTKCPWKIPLKLNRSAVWTKFSGRPNRPTDKQYKRVKRQLVIVNNDLPSRAVGKFVPEKTKEMGGGFCPKILSGNLIRAGDYVPFSTSMNVERRRGNRCVLRSSNWIELNSSSLLHSISSG